MRLLLTIATFATLLLTAGCQELPVYLDSGKVLARAGKSELRVRDLQAVVPGGLTGEDSVSFVGMYVDRWVKKQIKLQQAENLFSASAEDIESLVEEYRQSLLIRKLDQYFIDRQIDTVFTDEEVAAYYRDHIGDFKLDRTIVRGRILQFDQGYRQASKLLALMGSKSPARQKDFADICLKNNFVLADFTGTWVEFGEFLSYLPTLRSQNYDQLLKPGEIQQMRDSRSHYYFEITDVLRAGEPSPQERVRETIRRILFNQRQSEIIRRCEEQMLERARENGEVKIYLTEQE